MIWQIGKEIDFKNLQAELAKIPRGPELIEFEASDNLGSSENQGVAIPARLTSEGWEMIGLPDFAIRQLSEEEKKAIYAA